MRSTILIQALVVTSVLAVSTLTAQAGREGKGVYKRTCVYCHQTGVSGAPLFGDSAAWQPRIAQGREVLYRHALGGFKGMPAKGANPKLTDAEVRLAVDYMVQNASGQSVPQTSAQRMRVQSDR
ncbi:MAG: c-type cytochrome [Gammaproteobacteria bacterium]|nr:c-type cytochrome [Gammaproteobacteria bacterium]